jgi:cysteine desulfurase
MIDFDYNATTPVKESVFEAMKPYLNGEYGNPSSIHRIGQSTKAAVEDARETIAGYLQTDPEALTVTASGSEANTLAIRGVIRPPYDEKTIVTTPIEHSSVKDTVEWLEQQGAAVKRAPVDRHGQVDVDWFRQAVDAEVDLVTAMWVNNETGVILPIEEIGAICRDRDVHFHSDFVQGLGKIDFTYPEFPVDTISLSAHKIGGPKGTGVLVAPRSIKIEPLIFGGHQERDRRGGTENVASLVGFARAIRDMDVQTFERTRSQRNRFEQRLRDEIYGVHVVGEATDRVANTSGLLIEGIEGEDVVMRLDMEGIAVATGSACTSGSPQPSHVIRAMDLPEGHDPSSFVRVSLPPNTDPEDVDQLIKSLTDCVDTLRHEAFV